MWNCPAMHTSKVEGCHLCLTYETRADYRARWDWQAENRLGPWRLTDAEPEIRRPPPPKEPGLAKKAINFSADMAEWIAAGRPLVSDEVYQERRATCDACPDRNTIMDRCRWCGCPLSATPLGDRLRWGVPQCPARDIQGNPAPRWLAMLGSTTSKAEGDMEGG